MNINGAERPKSARSGKYDAQWQIEAFQEGLRSLPSTVSYAGIGSSYQLRSSYLDMNNDTRRVVCGGTVKVIGDSVCVLEADTFDGEVGNYLTECAVKLPVLSSDSLVIGAALYWDVADDRLTTDADSGTNKKAGYLLPYDNISTTSETISTVTLGDPFAAKWVKIMLRPN